MELLQRVVTPKDYKAVERIIELRNKV